MLGETLVDLAVDAIPVVLEGGQVDPVVKQRPQGAIGHALVEAGILRSGQIEQRVGVLALLDLVQRPVGRVGDGRRSSRTTCRPCRAAPPARLQRARRPRLCRPVGGVTRLETMIRRPSGINGLPRQGRVQPRLHRRDVGEPIPRRRRCSAEPMRTLMPPRSLTTRKPASSVTSSPTKTGCLPTKSRASSKSSIARPLSRPAGSNSTTILPRCSRNAPAVSAAKLLGQTLRSPPRIRTQAVVQGEAQTLVLDQSSRIAFGEGGHGRARRCHKPCVARTRASPRHAGGPPGRAARPRSVAAARASGRGRRRRGR